MVHLVIRPGNRHLFPTIPKRLLDLRLGFRKTKHKGEAWADETNLPTCAIERLACAATSAFGGAIEKAMGFKLTWHRLAPVNIPAREDALRLIRDWGGGRILTPVLGSPRI